MKKVSVIIPTYNRLNFLKAAVDSVLDQEFKDFELIIIDDGSTDGTPEWIPRLQEPCIRYLWQKNQGVSAARNKGIGESSGRYIAFLDSDDVLLAVIMRAGAPNARTYVVKETHGYGKLAVPWYVGLFKRGAFKDFVH